MNVRSILADPDYPRLKDYVLSHTGLAYYADKDEDLATRLGRRIAPVQASDCLSYLALLKRTSPGPS
jgi:chemotaxis protein methyltransferase CheR